MKRKWYMLCKKGILVFLLAAMVLSVTSCADAGTAAEELDNVKVELQPTEEPVKTPDFQSAVTPMQPYDKKPEAKAEPMEDWEKAYLEYVELLEGKHNYTYSLIYVDEDDIPELEIHSEFDSWLLTYHNGILDEIEIYGTGVGSTKKLSYIENGNLVYNKSEFFRSDEVYIYEIQNGYWKRIGSGRCWDYESLLEGPPDYNYKWDDELVTEEEYNRKIQEIFPEQNSKKPDRYYICAEICSLLKNRAVTSADHRYELIEADITWSEAEAACREKGGYLATITSWEEFEQIQEQIFREEKKGVTFFIGTALRNPVFRGFWQEGEPSYAWVSEDGRKVQEGAMAIIYSAENDRCGLRDVPDSLLNARPSFSGKIGYICEYNESPETEQEGDWEKAYLEYLDSFEDRDRCTYGFIYVDEDNIPELVIDTRYEAGGCKILTFHHNELEVLGTYRLRFTYIEKGNLLCNAGTHMGETPFFIYTVCDGHWDRISAGCMYDLNNGNDEYITKYFLEGEEVTEEEYDDQIYKIYPFDQAVWSEYDNTVEEIYSILKAENG